MTFIKTKKFLTYLSRRVFVLYIFVFLGFYFFVGTKFTQKAEMQALNRIMPSFTPLVKFTEEGVAMKKEVLEAQIKYFKVVLDNMPEFSAAHAMLGFSYYYLNEKEKALSSLTHAIDLNPENFWFVYNRGLINYRNKDYKHAAEDFKKALKTSSEITLEFMYSSKIYLPILLASAYKDSTAMLERLKAGREHCYQLMVLSHFYLEEYDAVMGYSLNAIQKNIDPRPFYFYFAGAGAYYLNQHKVAVYHLQESVKLSPEHSNSFYYLGMSIDALGNHELADRMLAQATKLKKPEEPFETPLNTLQLQLY
jgi:tetratricopeptide (TPR) repeat protein